MSRRKLGAVVAAIAAVLTIGVAANAAAGNGGSKSLEVEVAENGLAFSYDEDKVLAEGDMAGFPDYGSYFVTQGYLYPEGTLTCDDAGCDGVNADGSPQYPDEVIGEWTCYGVFVGEGAATASGPWVVTTQIFDLGDDEGETTIVTNGFETPEIDQFTSRAITGGTGDYSKARGEQNQALRGFNPTFGVTLSVEFDLD